VNFDDLVDYAVIALKKTSQSELQLVELYPSFLLDPRFVYRELIAMVFIALA
jgi:DNA-directed RNA polymerase delta subunit